MKRFFALILAMAMLAACAALAENVDLSGYSEEQLDSLETAVEAEIAARAARAEEAAEEAAEGGFVPLQKGSRGDEVRALQRLVDLGHLEGSVDGVFGRQTQRALEALQSEMGWEVTGRVDTQEDLDAIRLIGAGDGKNLALGTSSEWSAWMKPQYGQENQCFTITFAYIGNKEVGDKYTCQVEVEFKGVKADESGFVFLAQGPVDNAWDIPNLWNPSLVKLEAAPEDGVYRYTSTQEISDRKVGAVKYALQFRCDHWAEGAFRVRGIKVESGAMATDWCPADRDTGDGVNLFGESSSEWSEWYKPEYGQENQCVKLGTVHLGDKLAGDAYTVQVEVEFANVTATPDKAFSFHAQGAVDGAWDVPNIWNSSLVNLTEPPQSGVQRFVATQLISNKNLSAKDFDLRFRCDNWAGGSFRVRCVKVERGAQASAWTPGL